MGKKLVIADLMGARRLESRLLDFVVKDHHGPVLVLKVLSSACTAEDLAWLRSLSTLWQYSRSYSLWNFRTLRLLRYGQVLLPLEDATFSEEAGNLVIQPLLGQCTLAFSAHTPEVASHPHGEIPRGEVSDLQDAFDALFGKAA